MLREEQKLIEDVRRVAVLILECKIKLVVFSSFRQRLEPEQIRYMLRNS